MGFIERLQNIDRRIMYLLLALVIAAPLIWRVDLPMVVSPAVRGAYDAVEQMPDDKLAMIVCNWGSGTVAENRPQTEAFIHHLMMRNKKLAIIAFDPQGAKFSFDSAKRIAAEYGKVYGVDWVHWGYRPASNIIPMLQSLPRDIIRTVGVDINGTPLGDVQVMKDVKTISDIGLIVDISSIGELDWFIAYIHGPYRTPIVYGPTAVMAPEGFNPLDAGQIKGMLTGMKGAAEYEHLLGRKGFASKAAGALSSSHLLIIALIILGNVGYITARRRAQE